MELGPYELWVKPWGRKLMSYLMAIENFLTLEISLLSRTQDRLVAYDCDQLMMLQYACIFQNHVAQYKVEYL